MLCCKADKAVRCLPTLPFKTNASAAKLCQAVSPAKAAAHAELQARQALQACIFFAAIYNNHLQTPTLARGCNLRRLLRATVHAA